MNSEEQRTSCPGFLDAAGVWNNGFECPPLAGQIRICCESESQRYCCTLDSFQKTSSSSNLFQAQTTMETSLFLPVFKYSTIFTLPIILTCALALLAILLMIFLTICLCTRHRNRTEEQQQQQRKENRCTKTTLLDDHFPFSPPHHQFLLREHSPPLHNASFLSHQQARDNLTTTTTIAPSSSSSASGRTPSDIYFPDWKDFLITADQPMNAYPTMSSHSIELHHEQSYPFYHGKRQPNDAMV